MKRIVSDYEQQLRTLLEEEKSDRDHVAVAVLVKYSDDEKSDSWVQILKPETLDSDDFNHVFADMTLSFNVTPNLPETSPIAQTLHRLHDEGWSYMVGWGSMDRDGAPIVYMGWDHPDTCYGVNDDHAKIDMLSRLTAEWKKIVHPKATETVDKSGRTLDSDGTIVVHARPGQAVKVVVDDA